MDPPTRFDISSEATAAQALDHFNGFHDGFIKRMVVKSEDQIGEDLGQTCTGLFEVEIDFAHYNYGQAAEPFHSHRQIVRAEFRAVRDILADFRSGFLGNTIITLSINAGTRRNVGQTDSEPCLILHWGRHFYHEAERRHELREFPLFSFREATFMEMPLE
jgi:hypothetical protein